MIHSSCLNLEARKAVRQLTTLEIETLSLIAQGASNREIANKLELSHEAVSVTRDSLMRKLDARCTADVVWAAITAGVE